MAEENDIEVSVPRRVKRQKHRSNAPAATPDRGVGLPEVECVCAIR